MRVAIVAPPWVAVPPPGYGGTEIVLDGLARGLASAGHDVLLFATGDSTCPVPTAWVLEEAAGIGTAGSATELRHVVNAYDVVREWGADIVHDHTLIGPVFADRFDGLPVVTTNHGPFESELADYYRAIAHRVPIIAISKHQASTARDTPVAAVIHHGIDLDRFHAGRGDGRYAAFLGRMSPDKGVHVAARVARAAGVPLKIAAKVREPHEVAYFESQVAPLLGRGVEFVGEVGGDEKVAFLRDAACLLNPIDWPEPFGMVMIEALACGTPVVATRRGSVPEVVEHERTGFVCTSEKELVRALARVDRISRATCRAVAVERFSIERMVADHVTLYEQVVAEPRRAVPLA